MSQLNEAAIRNVVSEVLAQMQSKGTLAMPTLQARPGKHGVFDEPDQAVAAARRRRLGSFHEMICSTSSRDNELTSSYFISSNRTF